MDGATDFETITYRPGSTFSCKSPSPALLALVTNLYDAATVNRDFVEARCKAEENGGEVLEKYRRKIVEQFFLARGKNKLKLGEARKAIRDYRIHPVESLDKPLYSPQFGNA